HVPAPDSAGEMLRALCPDRELVQLCIAVPEAWRGELPSGLPRPQSCGCSPPARPDGLPLRGSRGPLAPRGSSDGPELARAASQSRGPSDGPWSLSGARAPAAPERELTEPWLRGYGHLPPPL